MKSGSKLLRIMALLAIWLLVLMPLAPVGVCYADTANPDSPPTIESFNVYRHLLEPNDFLLVIYANIPYGIPPSTVVPETFIWRMLATDNVTVLGSTVGSAYNNGGYGYNVYSMYWDTANATASLAWLTEYTVRLNGNLVVFDTPPEYNFTIDVTDYTTETTSADIKTEMGARILLIATELNTRWALPPSYLLTASGETGTILSIYGEAFFRGAIFGLQGMVPQIFQYVITDLDVEPRDWDTEYAENVTSQWDGTWVQTAREASTALFSTTYDLPSLMFLAGAFIGMVFVGLVVAGDTWGGLVDGSIVLLMGGKLALIGLGYVGLIAALCIIYVSGRIWKLW